MEQTTKKTKNIFISLCILLCVFVLAGIILTFVLKSKQAQLSDLQQQTAEVSQKFNDAKEKHDNIFGSDVSDLEITTDDLTDEYKDDYVKHEGTDENGNPYGEEGEKVIEIKK